MTVQTCVCAQELLCLCSWAAAAEDVVVFSRLQTPPLQPLPTSVLEGHVVYLFLRLRPLTSPKLDQL